MYMQKPVYFRDGSFSIGIGITLSHEIFATDFHG